MLPSVYFVLNQRGPVPAKGYLSQGADHIGCRQPGCLREEERHRREGLSACLATVSADLGVLRGQGQQTRRVAGRFEGLGGVNEGGDHQGNRRVVASNCQAHHKKERDLAQTAYSLLSTVICSGYTMFGRVWQRWSARVSCSS